MSRIPRLTLAALTFAVIGIATAPPAQADPVFFGPTPYTSSANSPFNSVTFTYFHLENFEDDALNTPGVVSAGGSVIGVEDFGNLIDSVDADDGTVNGTCANCRSYFGDTFTFTFNAATLGGLPTHAGIVWTDGNNPITFQAFDSNGVLLGTITGNHADNAFEGTTAEDRFYGLSFSGGISRITISSGEVDHLQYGLVSQPNGAAPVPEPTTMLLLGTGLVGVAVKARKRRKAARNEES